MYVGALSCPTAQDLDRNLRADASGNRKLARTAAEQTGDVEGVIDPVGAIMFEHDAVWFTSTRMRLRAAGKPVDLPPLEARREYEHLRLPTSAGSAPGEPVLARSFDRNDLVLDQCSGAILVHLRPHSLQHRAASCSRFDTRRIPENCLVEIALRIIDNQDCPIAKPPFGVGRRERHAAGQASNAATNDQDVHALHW